MRRARRKGYRPMSELFIGDEVKPYGNIAAILITGGERYYMLLKGKDVALMPAVTIEQKPRDVPAEPKERKP